MNGRDIESILAEHGGLRRSFKNLESSIKNCNKNAVLQMLDTKTELEILSKTKTINFNDWETVNKKIRDIGNKFSDRCACNVKMI